MLTLYMIYIYIYINAVGKNSLCFCFAAERAPTVDLDLCPREITVRAGKPVDVEIQYQGKTYCTDSKYCYPNLGSTLVLGAHYGWTPRSLDWLLSLPAVRVLSLDVEQATKYIGQHGLGSNILWVSP